MKRAEKLRTAVIGTQSVSRRPSIAIDSMPGRERVPGHEINAIVSKAIAEAAREFGVSVSQIDADNVRDNAQKTGRFVVRR